MDPRVPPGATTDQVSMEVTACTSGDSQAAQQSQSGQGSRCVHSSQAPPAGRAGPAPWGWFCWSLEGEAGKALGPGCVASGSGGGLQDPCTRCGLSPADVRLRRLIPEPAALRVLQTFNQSLSVLTL
ncbi:Hypothetical predicted protein, partial [Marmota monax]